MIPEQGNQHLAKLMLEAICVMNISAKMASENQKGSDGVDPRALYPVVHCAVCKFREPSGRCMNPALHGMGPVTSMFDFCSGGVWTGLDDFCSYGEREEDEK